MSTGFRSRVGSRVGIALRFVRFVALMLAVLNAVAWTAEHVGPWWGVAALLTFTPLTYRDTRAWITGRS